jgi:hypothetical protein
VRPSGGSVGGPRPDEAPVSGPFRRAPRSTPAVRDAVADALSIYSIDVDRLGVANPDVIVTQDLCEVCAVSLDDVRAAVARLARRDVVIVNLHPTRLADIWDDVSRVAEALGRAPAARRRSTHRARFGSGPTRGSGGFPDGPLATIAHTAAPW